MKIKPATTFVFSLLLYKLIFAWGKVIDGGCMLSSTFCEPRWDHFHIGVDLRTPQGAGMAVYAPEDGYVVRVKVSPYGYGKQLYFKLVSGEVIMFAHLSGFAEQIEELVRKRQMNLKRYNVELWARKDELKFKKGEILAYTGETGAGTPHLHLECHNEEFGIAINPISNLNTSDHCPPVIKRVLFIPIGEKSFVRGAQAPLSVNANAYGKNYFSIKYPVSFIGSLALAIDCTDFTSSAIRNNLGIYSLSLFENDSIPIFSRTFDYLPDSLFYLTQYAWTGFEGNIYYNLFAMDLKAGILENNGNKRNLKIVCADYFGNRATLKLELIPGKNNQQKRNGVISKNNELGSLEANDSLLSLVNPTLSIIKVGDGYYLKIVSERELTSVPALIAQYTDSAGKGLKSDTIFAEARGNHSFFARFLPPRRSRRMALHIIFPLEAKSTIKKYSIETYFVDTRDRRIIKAFGGKFQARFLPGALSEPIWCFFLEESGSSSKQPQYIMFPERLPLTRKIELGIRIPEGEKQTGIMIASSNGGKARFLGARIENGYVVGNTLFGGIFTCDLDTTAPLIKFPFVNNARVRNLNRLYCRISDEGSGFGGEYTPELYINGEWVPAEFDPEKNLLEYRLQNPLEPGKYEIRVVAIDRCSNRAEAKRTIIVEGQNTIPKKTTINRKNRGSK